MSTPFSPASVNAFLRHLLLLPVLLGPVVVEASQAQALSPDEAEALMDRANRFYQDGAFQEALSDYESIAAAGFESPDLYYNLGNAYFKVGNLGRSILSYERTLKRKPGDSDASANLALARSLTADEIEPLPRFWVVSALSWWVSLIPRVFLPSLVVLSYLLLGGGFAVRILTRSPKARSWTGWVLIGSAVALALFGSTLLARDGVVGGTEWGVVLVEEIPVQSAPSPEDDLTLFHVHEGTKVRLDQRTDEWSEVVLEDGRVGWIPSNAVETI